MPRFFCPSPLVTGAMLDLPPSVARHVQVLRLQPGDKITLFNGLHGDPAPGVPDVRSPGEFSATISRMGRSDVLVQVGAHHAIEREAGVTVHLAVGMPANERMDWLVEKASELGVSSIQPLITERSVLRLTGDRADKKVAHWQSVAIAACEQCGGNRVPRVLAMRSMAAWTQALPVKGPETRWLLSLCEGSTPLQQHLAHVRPQHATFLSGPEGGLSPAEEAVAASFGFAPVTLGPRVLRAETAAITALARLLG